MIEDIIIGLIGLLIIAYSFNLDLRPFVTIFTFGLINFEKKDN